MIITVVLIAALGIVFLYALSQKKRAFWPAVILGLISLAGSALVLAPGVANAIANAVYQRPLQLTLMRPGAHSD